MYWESKESHKGENFEKTELPFLSALARGVNYREDKKEEMYYEKGLFTYQ